MSGRYDVYDEDYFERGIETGKSCYQNYRWIPELTIPMAMTMIDHLEIKRGEKILDFGCSKGYLVRALRLLYRDAWGVDVSSYAIKNAEENVKKYCKRFYCTALPFPFDYCIAKDVFEHIDKKQLIRVLEDIDAKKLFAVIPLGDGMKYDAPANDLDSSHVICESAVWWEDTFFKTGWNFCQFTYKIEGIKDGYYSQHPKSHGFFTLQKRRKDDS